MSTPQTEPSADAQQGSESSPFQSMHDVRCPVAALIGTGSLTMRQCLELKPDSVVTLSQQPGDDLELRVNGVLIGHGEVVIFEDSTSIRVTRIAPSDGSGE
jgi:flagellar motor switch protein FliN/FliY